MTGRVFEVTKRSGCPLGDSQPGLDEDVDAEVAAAFGPFVGLLGEHGGPMMDSVPGILTGG